MGQRHVEEKLDAGKEREGECLKRGYRGERSTTKIVLKNWRKSFRNVCSSCSFIFERCRVFDINRREKKNKKSISRYDLHVYDILRFLT